MTINIFTGNIERRCILILLCFLGAATTAYAQATDSVRYRFASRKSRTELSQNLLNRKIKGYLNMPLADSTESYWEEGFYAMQLLRQRPAWTVTRLRLAWSGIQQRTPDFQRALLRVSHALFPNVYRAEATGLQQTTRYPDIYGLCTVYLQSGMAQPLPAIHIQQQVQKKFGITAMDTPVLRLLVQQYEPVVRAKAITALQNVVHHSFMPGTVVVISIQRRNRDYPGLVLVRDTTGRLLRDATGQYWSVPQIARSINNLPGGFSMGNTPQGIFRMFGFGRSAISFIGPTDNLQLAMPYEMPVQAFTKNQSEDSIWSPAAYAALLPRAVRNYTPLWQTYYASAGGRTEIIAHGTTVDPSYYSGTPYFPQTPTVGCLCTKEIWSATGALADSDQQRLADAVKRAGGANGYLVMLELDDTRSAVTIREIVQLLGK
jgi:hypothetical protein